MSDFDPNPTVLRGRGGMKPGASKSSQAVNAARRRGEEVSTDQKYGAGGNRQGGTSLNTAVLDRETEELKHAKVSMDVGKLIQKGRQAKGWTQKELATKIQEKPQVVTEYEQSKAMPNQQILAKMERALEMKLRGKDKGAPLVPKSAAKKQGGK